jgi:hypothetical protein
MQGGMMAMTGAVAADRALAAAIGGPVAIVDLQVTYLALAKVGPVVSRTAVLVADAGIGTARVELVDAGAPDRLATVIRARGVSAA